MNFKTKYFNLNRILLLVIGLWPYQQSNLIRFQFICLSSILTTSVIFQCTVFISPKCTPDLFIKVLASIFFFIFGMINYNLFCFNLKGVKDMLEQLFDTCNKVKDANEIAIIDEYGCNSKRFTIVLTILGAIFILVFIVLSFSSDYISNVFLSTNMSQSHNLLIVEYFINQEKYFYLILLHSFVSICILLTAIIGVGTIYITYLKLTCGMFKIASYRIERAMSVNMLQNINPRKNVLVIKGLICAVDIHRQAMKLSKFLLSKVETMMLFLMIFGVLSLSLNLLRITSSQKDIKEILISFINSILLFLYCFMANYSSQIIIDHCHQIYVTAYNTRWYLAPLCIQKIILFLLIRRSKVFTMNIGGIFDGSIEGFATLIKASVSYFTVIHSIQ